MRDPTYRHETRWHADETRWQVFVQTEGEAGYRWYAWVFSSTSTVLCKLDTVLSSHVPLYYSYGFAAGRATGRRYVAY